MLKKLFLFFVLICYISFWNISFTYAITDQELHDFDCEYSWNCIEKDNFRINPNSISPWMDIQENDTEKNVNYALGTIIQTLMIALWGLSILIMTIGAGYIIMHHWQDELLSKWKSIFMSWIFALVVALSSYYIVSILTYILYK